MKNYKDDLLQHYGIPGQKHGKRRFQNEDGSLTAAGRARYGGGGTTDGGHGILNVRDQRTGERSSKTMTKEERMKSSGPSRDTRTTVTKNGTRLTERTNDKGESIVERRYADGHYHTTYTDNYNNMTQTTGRRGSDGRMRVNKEQYKVTGDDIEAVNRRKTRNIQGEKHEVVKAGSKQEPAQKKAADPRAASARAARDADESRRNARADASGRTVTGPNTRVTKEGGSYGITKRDKQGNERTTYTTSAPVQRVRDAMGLSTRVYSQKNKNGKDNVDVRTSNGRIYKYVSNTGKSGYQVADMNKTRVSKNFSGNGIGASAARSVANAAARVLASGGTAKKKRKG